MNQPSSPQASPAAEPKYGLCDVARRVYDRSVDVWGHRQAVGIFGLSPAVQHVLQRAEKLARFQEPALILGESGVGKESLAHALYLLSDRAGRPFEAVNCPQFHEGNLTVSELFGHKRGSFTGAERDRKGCFETADRGVVFLDEIGDLHMSAQVMLLRWLANGEFQPLGSDVKRRVDVRVVAATNRSLNRLAADGQFRRDLLFRLRYFLLEIPPLRARGKDWYLLLERFLERLHRRYGVRKRFSAEALQLLETYPWPGNVRELMGVVTAGYAFAEREVIVPEDIQGHLEIQGSTAEGRLEGLLRRLSVGRADFWAGIRDPFLDRDLNRMEVRWLISRGLEESRGSYRRLLVRWSGDAADYQKFMDFLRHHRLKPQARR